MSREQVMFKLAAGHYGTEAPAMLARAERWPGIWQYTRDRHRAVAKHMPAGTWEFADCAESEERIKALAKGRHW